MDDSRFEGRDPSVGHWTRGLSEEHVWLLVRDVLAAGIVGLGYYKSPGGGFGLFGSTTAANRPKGPLRSVRDALRAVGGLCDHYLRMMTPYVRIAVHVDAAQLEGFADVCDPGTRMYAWLAEYLEANQYPFAVFSSLRVLDREFSNQQIRDGVLVSPFHAELDQAQLDRYVALVDAGKRGGIGHVLVWTEKATYDALALTNRTTLNGVQVGQAHARCFVAAPPAAECVWFDPSARDYAARTARVAALLERSLGGAPLPARVCRVARRATDARIFTTAVSDGLNFVVAIGNYGRAGDFQRHPASWRKRQAAFKGDLVLDPRVRRRLTHARVAGYRASALRGGTVRPKPDTDTWEITVPAGDTLLVYLGADVQGLASCRSAIPAKVAALRRRLTELGDAGRTDPPFEVGHGLALLDAVGALRDAQSRAVLPERALAALVMLRNTLLLAVRRSAADATRIEVRAIYVDVRTPSAAPIAAAGAVVRLHHVLNGHEEQRDPRDVVIDANGAAEIEVRRTRHPRWRFTQPTPEPRGFDPEQDREHDPVEIHVHDPHSGAHAFALVTGDVPVPPVGPVP